MKNLFVTVVGQFTNVGDVMHRKEILSWFKNAGEFHVYVGKAPQDFIDGLELPESAHLYSNLLKWLWAVATSNSDKPVFLFNPGEMNLGLKRLIGELALLPFELLVRSKKGAVLRIGVATKSDSSSSAVWLWNHIFSATTHLYWRTSESKKMFGQGSVIPDLAFNEVEIEMQRESAKLRKHYLTLSMRSDRPNLPDKSLEAITQVAGEHDLEIIVVSQVRMDNQMTRYLSKKFNSEAVIWADDFSHEDQENKLRSLYRESALVLSDRLHVLIASVTEGAIPAALLPIKIRKVEDHFSVIGIERITMVAKNHTKNQIADFLESMFSREAEFRDAVLVAQDRIEEIRSKILADIH